jgi:hypothetical protein
MLMSGYAEDALQELSELAADRVLVLKPFTSHALTSQIAELLRSSAHRQGLPTSAAMRA